MFNEMLRLASFKTPLRKIAAESLGLEKIVLFFVLEIFIQDKKYF